MIHTISLVLGTSSQTYPLMSKYIAFAPAVPVMYAQPFKHIFSVIIGKIFLIPLVVLALKRTEISYCNTRI